jgi:hypothetical protein
MDFLTRLVVRTLQPEEAFRPRPASMFEPQQLEAALSIEPLTHEKPPGRRSNSEPQPGPIRNERDSLPSLLLAQPARGSDSLLESSVPGAPATSTPASDFERPPSTSRVAPVQSPEANEDPPHVPRPEIRAGNTQRTEYVHSLELARQLPGSPRPEAVRAAGHPRFGQRAAPVFGPPANPEVTIEVTIGRVDVRSAHVPSPAKRQLPERRSPALSLDDYLKQRDRGRG